MDVVEFESIGRLPAPGDNVAIASRNLRRGQRFTLGGGTHELKSDLLEGQRFAIRPIAPGEALLSWGLPFGHAITPISPGEYLCNEGILEALKLRRLNFELPASANFEDYTEEYRLDEEAFVPGIPLPLHASPGTFQGFARPGGRGVGTRNDIVLLGTSSRTAAFVHRLEALLKPEAARHGIPGNIVAVAHTEGGSRNQPNNLELVLRTLAGFMVHPNVGAVLAVDYADDVLNNRVLEDYLIRHGYPLKHVLHRFCSVRTNFAKGLEAAAQQVREWFGPVGEMQRSTQPLSALRIALQCGGSDAFSGVSGNPLAGRVAREVIRHGGAAALAETDELIGAEPYILSNTRDLATARQFLDRIAAFRERVAWHGHSAEGNPSGGNKFRGLYNIALKSIGAARKKDPEVRLDHVIDYGQPMRDPGFYFMDSPGNDLESIAGQVASGCNLIFFITGNGSITNFPFVPTIKFVTTTGRWELLRDDMDINAGRYQDGTPMEDLAEETFGYAVEVASGRPSVGERAGHAQVSIWRDWRQTDGSRLEVLLHAPRPDGRPLAFTAGDILQGAFDALPARDGYAADQLGLIVPTSLCSGQIALQIAGRLNAGELASGHGVSRFVALPHTEGCGASSGENEDHFTRTMLGHLVHPCVREALLLEHGCERTHNDLMRHVLEENGIDPGRFGYASIQLDGGIDKVAARVVEWFQQALPHQIPMQRRTVGLEALSLGLAGDHALPGPVAEALAAVAASIAGSGGTTVIAANAGVLQNEAFLARLGWNSAPPPSLDYGQVAARPGLHIMATPGIHWVETLTGLGGTGVQLLLTHVAYRPVQGHPMIPLVQFASDAALAGPFAEDLDAVLEHENRTAAELAGDLLRLLCATASGDYRPRCSESGNSDFQLTRGLLGVSL